MAEPYPYQWLTTGEAFYAALLEDIRKAAHSIRLEMYIFTTGYPGDAVRDELLAAAQRGVTVKVLLDAFGSYELPAQYWEAASKAGVEVRHFNPLALKRIAFRDHRKLMVCDDHVAYVSGFNISHLEAGDGVTRGWRDLGLRLTGSVAKELSAAFEQMLRLADFRHPRLPRLRFGRGRGTRHCPPGQTCPHVLCSGPGQEGGTFKRMLLADIKRARDIRIISAYFLPTTGIRRNLARAARVGSEVRIITAGRTDVRMARYAGRALYSRLLRSGIRIFEYEPQVLHTKLIIVDEVVYVGSANLDTRSLNINYELLVRIHDTRLAHEARLIFNEHLPHCLPIERRTWRQSRGGWEKLVERVSRFLLSRVDTLFARRQLSKLR